MELIKVINGRYFYCVEDEMFVVIDVDVLLNPGTGTDSIVGHAWMAWRGDKVEQIWRSSALCQTFLSTVFKISERACAIEL